MATDNLVDDLLNAMNSFTEEAMCPFCEGHGAMSQGRADVLVAALPPSVITGLEAKVEYVGEKKATMLSFRLNGTFGAKDGLLAKAKDWNDIEGELRSQFEKLITQLQKAWDDQTLIRKLKRDELLAQKTKQPNDVSPQLSEKEFAQKMASQNKLLEKLMKEADDLLEQAKHAAMQKQLLQYQQAQLAQQANQWGNPKDAQAALLQIQAMQNQQQQGPPQGLNPFPSAETQQGLLAKLMGSGLLKKK